MDPEKADRLNDNNNICALRKKFREMKEQSEPGKEIDFLDGVTVVFKSPTPPNP